MHPGGSSPFPMFWPDRLSGQFVALRSYFPVIPKSTHQENKYGHAVTNDDAVFLARQEPIWYLGASALGLGSAAGGCHLFVEGSWVSLFPRVRKITGLLISVLAVRCNRQMSTSKPDHPSHEIPSFWFCPAEMRSLHQRVVRSGPSSDSIGDRVVHGAFGHASRFVVCWLQHGAIRSGEQQPASSSRSVSSGRSSGMNPVCLRSER
mmetsp:Transcript_3623/g.8068  ORF Transcript_3623/g.8068 Transcript_3623/m.8068 type:complete len:206 (+) Transcript_3623:1610-2227(+)